MNRIIFKYIIISFLFVPSTNVFSTSVITENFDYAVGSALTANGWSSFNIGTSVPTNDILIASPSLSFPGGIAAPGKAISMNGQGNDATKSFTLIPITNGTSVYASLLVNFSSVESTGTGDTFFSFNDGTSANIRGAIFIKRSCFRKTCIWCGQAEFECHLCWLYAFFL